jgi:hypothetical protein
MFRVVILIKGEMPTPLKSAVLDSAVGLKNTLGGTDNNHGVNLPAAVFIKDF